MNATLPILPAAAAVAAPAPNSPGAPTSGAMPPAGGTVAPAGTAKDAAPKDFRAALSAAEKDDGRRAAPHAAPTAADLAMLGMPLPVTGNPPPLVPSSASMPPSPQPSPTIQAAVAPAAGAGPGSAPQNAGPVPGAAANVDARSRFADVAAQPGEPAAALPGPIGAAANTASSALAAATPAAAANTAADMAAAASPDVAARGRPGVLDSSRRLVATADGTHAAAALHAATAAPPTSAARAPAAAAAESATPAYPATQASAAPPPSAAVPALQMTAAVNPAAASFAAAAAANDGVQPKSPSPIDRAAPADSAPVAPAPVAPASARTPASTAPTARTAAIAPNPTTAADKPAHAANGASPSAVSSDGAAGAAAAFAAPGVAPSARHDGASAATLPLHAGINTPEFSRELADRVTWMVDRGLNGASLQVNPPHLGPIELRVSVERGHAAVWMSAQNATTLDALQSNAPKLREMLGNQGFGQVSVDISQRSFQDRSPHPQKDAWTAASGGPASRAAIPTGSVRGARPAQGAIDAYA